VKPGNAPKQCSSKAEVEPFQVTNGYEKLKAMMDAKRKELRH
jgi:hypothetical protein